MSLTVRVVRSVVVAALAVALVAVAWLRVDGGSAAGSVGVESTPSPIVSPSITSSVAVSPSAAATIACGGEAIIVDGVLPTIKNLARESQTIAIGTVQADGAPSWNRPDGAPQTGGPSRAIIYRPITIDGDTPIQGSTATTVNARLIGGTIGCYTVTLEGGPNPAVGGRDAFYAHPALDSVTSPTVGEAWPVTADGKIKTDYDGVVTPAALIKAVELAP